jgi:hypothetical protein
MNARNRRGQPLIALALLLLGWVAVRAAVWDWPAAAQTLPNPPVQMAAAPALAAPTAAVPATTAPATPAVPVWPQLSPVESQTYTPVEPALPRPMPVLVPVEPAPQGATDTPRIAAGHQLLWLAGVSQLAMPPEVMQAFAARPPLAPPPAVPAAAPARERRWSGDTWLLLRRGGNGFNLPGAGLPGANLPTGAYGASQAGAVIRYRLAPSSPHRPAAYLRASSGLHQPRGEEAALGLSLRPLPRVPVAAMAEARVTRTLTGNIVRPAVALVSEFPPQPLPLGIRAEAYVQAGWVGGKDSTAFADGQARLEKPLLSAGRLELRAGAGAWGGAQRGAQRLDVGPTATLALPLGGANGRVSADWRFRVGGDAAPDSGPAVTLSAGF